MLIGYSKLLQFWLDIDILIYTGLVMGEESGVRISCKVLQPSKRGVSIQTLEIESRPIQHDYLEPRPAMNVI